MNPLLSSILEVAKKVAIAVVPGAPEAIEAFQSIKAAVEQAKVMVNPTPQDAAALDAELLALEQHVFAHADRTADSLRG